LSRHGHFVVTDYGQVGGSLRFPDGISHEDHAASERAIKAIGTNALPFLRPLLLSRESSAHLKIRSWMEKLRRPPLELATEEKHQRAAAALWALRASSIPLLIEAFQDESTPVDTRIFAAYMFQMFPKSSRPALRYLKKEAGSGEPLLARVSSLAIRAIENGNADRSEIEVYP
jgi:hypothetical protein